VQPASKGNRLLLVQIDQPLIMPPLIVQPSLLLQLAPKENGCSYSGGSYNCCLRSSVQSESGSYSCSCYSCDCSYDVVARAVACRFKAESTAESDTPATASRSATWPSL
jgi:hypothetical protein